MAINAKLQTLINIKNDIGTAITNKGGTITVETPFFNYAAEVDNISTGGGAYSTWAVEDTLGRKYTPYISAQENSTYTASFDQNSIYLNASSEFQPNIGTNITVTDIDVITSWVTTTKFVAFNKQTLALRSSLETGGASGDNSNITKAGNFLYAVHSNTGNPLRKLHQLNFGTVATVNLNFMPSVISADDVYVYAPQGNIRVYHTSNLVFVGNAIGGQTVTAPIVSDETHFYVGGLTNLIKYHKSNLAQDQILHNYGWAIKGMKLDGNNIYVGGNALCNPADVRLKTINKITGEVVAESSVLFQGIDAIASDENYVYALLETVGSNLARISKFYKENLVKVGESISGSSLSRGLVLDNNHLYTTRSVGGNTQRISRWDTYKPIFSKNSVTDFNYFELNNNTENPIVLSNVSATYVKNVQGSNSIITSENMVTIPGQDNFQFPSTVFNFFKMPQSGAYMYMQSYNTSSRYFEFRELRRASGPGTTIRKWGGIGATYTAVQFNFTGLSNFSTFLDDRVMLTMSGTTLGISNLTNWFSNTSFEVNPSYNMSRLTNNEITALSFVRKNPQDKFNGTILIGTNNGVLQKAELYYNKVTDEFRITNDTLTTEVLNASTRLFVNKIASDGTNVYVSSNFANIKVYKQEDFSYVGEFPGEGDINLDGNSIYTNGRKYNINNFALEATGTGYNFLFSKIDGNFIYAVQTNNALAKFHKNNFTFINITNTGGTPIDLHFDDDYIYYIRSDSFVRYKKNTFTSLDNKPIYEIKYIKEEE